MRWLRELPSRFSSNLADIFWRYRERTLLNKIQKFTKIQGANLKLDEVEGIRTHPPMTKAKSGGGIGERKGHLNCMQFEFFLLKIALLAKLFNWRRFVRDIG